MYLLVKASGNYGDEFDLNAFKVFSKEDWDAFLADQKQVINNFFLAKAKQKRDSLTEKYNRNVRTITDEIREIYAKYLAENKVQDFYTNYVYSNSRMINYDAYQTLVAGSLENYIITNMAGYHPEFTISFGTNEQLYYNSFENYLREFSATEITDEEYLMLKRLFCGYGDNIEFGDHPGFNYFGERYYEYAGEMSN